MYKVAEATLCANASELATTKFHLEAEPVFLLAFVALTGE